MTVTGARVIFNLSRTVLLTPTVTAQQVQRVRALALVVSDSHRVGIVLALFTDQVLSLSMCRVLCDTCPFVVCTTPVMDGLPLWPLLFTG